MRWQPGINPSRAQELARKAEEWLIENAHVQQIARPATPPPMKAALPKPHKHREVRRQSWIRGRARMAVVSDRGERFASMTEAARVVGAANAALIRRAVLNGFKCKGRLWVLAHPERVPA